MIPKFATAISKTISKLCALHAQLAQHDAEYSGGESKHPSVYSSRVELTRDIEKAEKNLAALLLEPGAKL